MMIEWCKRDAEWCYSIEVSEPKAQATSMRVVSSQGYAKAEGGKGEA